MVFRKRHKLFSQYLLVGCLLLLPCRQLLAQDKSQSNIDQLLQQLLTARSDTNKVNLLYKICAFYLNTDNDHKKALEYGTQVQKLAEQLGWMKGQVMAYRSMSRIYNASNEYQKALENGLKGYELARKSQLPFWQHSILIETGIANSSLHNNEQAIKDYKMAIAYFLQSKDADDKISETTWFPVPAWFWPACNLGQIYYNLNKDAFAVHYFQQILNRFIKEKDSLGIRTALSVFSTYNFMQNDYYKTLKYDLESLKYFKPGDSTNEHANVLGLIGGGYTKTKDYVKALEYYQNSITIQRVVSPGIRLNANTGMRDIYYILQDFNKVVSLDIEIFNDATKMDLGYGDKVDLYGNLIEDNIQARQYEKALFYANKGLMSYSQKENLGAKARLMGLLSRVYYFIRRYDDALRTVKESMEMNADYTIIPVNYMCLATTIRDAPAEVLLKHGVAYAGRNNQAIKNLKVALSYKQHMKPVYLQECYKELSMTYEMMKDYKNFHETYKQYIAMRDSSVNQINQNAFISRLAGIRFEKKEDSLKYQQRLTEDQLKQQTLITAQQRRYYISGIIALLIISFFIARNYHNQRKSNKLLAAANTQITAEKQRSDNLLLNILPVDIAEELKTKGSADARLFEEVTVLFTDFVNFTTISEMLTPQELVDELHYCFKAFDEIISKYSIEKIKTIGDAYLAVAGLPNADAQHAKHTVSAALEIRQFIQDRMQRMGSRSFDIRIGIHSGSVVAGIVGVKKFAYDIWGDTVNTAARMEQHSMPGQINLSEKTYELVKKEFAFTYRGEIVAKNKGALKMYFVEKQPVSMSVSS